ncbi:DUF6292 family protein [Streptomyces glaucescens]|uniref:DUF6292 domain-containing protein n=1 Tax=Streptomyces glaucescens TaxID=1907 RepID=A0A089Z9J7_STRGA|nr:DUF6292 family protein [Streptomyces glaucescens]AIS02436.1 hypothetical protein SGLAU_32520 [Streptomyces glaucescens]
MIRAGRRHLVRTLADIAAQLGIAEQTLLNSGRHQAPGFPAPLGAGRTRLYDGEQVDAYLAGRPVPQLPAADDDEDLLDRQEAAALRDEPLSVWDRRRKDPAVREYVVVVGGVEHWPRRIVREYTPAPRRRTSSGAGGRPVGAGDQVPRDQLPQRVAQLLDDNPALTAGDVADRLGVHRNTATAALVQCRAERMADLMEQRAVTAAEAAAALGYPVGQTRRASVRAEAVLRGRRARPYLAAVAQALHARGWRATSTPPDVQHPEDDLCVAALTLDAPEAPAPALVWSERHGWRTATSRRHPLGRGAAWPPPGDGVRHLATGTTPTPTDLVHALDSTG